MTADRRLWLFACRQCNRRAYRSQRETPDDRASRRANKLRARLGWDAGILNDIGGKPRCMHWGTFVRLRARHNHHVNVSLAGIAARLGLTDERFDAGGSKLL